MRFQQNVLVNLDIVKRIRIEIERLDDTSVLVKYPQTIASVTEGQEAVFYDGDKCIGGGVIEEVFKDGKNLNQLIMETANGHRG